MNILDRLELDLEINLVSGEEMCTNKEISFLAFFRIEFILLMCYYICYIVVFLFKTR